MWLRLYEDIVDNPKLRLLPFEDRWHFVALLCCKKAGLLDHPDAEFARNAARLKLGLDEPAFTKAVARLAKVHLIDAVTLQPLGWEARQFDSDSSRARTKAWRERMKRHGDVTVTAQETETETETEEVPQVSKEKAPAVPVGGAKKRAPFDPRPMLEAYAAKLPMLPQPRALTPARRRSLAARWRDSFDESLDTWREFLDRVAASSFLTGRAAPSPGHSRWRCDLDFLLKPEKINAIAEGKYDDEA